LLLHINCDIIQTAWTLERYERDDGESPVEDFINALPTKVRARVWAHLTHLQQVGNRAAAPISEALGEGLFALRVSVGRYEVRILYAFLPGQKIVLLHGFLKKTRTIAARELETARARLRELQGS
jgi:phage-related protein